MHAPSFPTKSMSSAGGGAERVPADVTATLAGRGHAITIVAFDRPGDKNFYAVCKDIRGGRLGIGDRAGCSGIGDVVRRINAFRKLPKRWRPMWRGLHIEQLCSAWP